MANPFYGNTGFGRNPYLPVSPVTSVGARPFGFNTQPIMQPSMPNTPQNLQSMIPQSNIIWIDDFSQIAGFPTGSGWQQWFGLKNEQVLFVRETDMNGVTQPIRKVRYEIETENTAPVQTQAAPVQPAPEARVEGVGREEFEQLAATVKNLTEKLADLLK